MARKALTSDTRRATNYLWEQVERIHSTAPHGKGTLA
jgi:hypothetical protein